MIKRCHELLQPKPKVVLVHGSGGFVRFALSNLPSETRRFLGTHLNPRYGFAKNESMKEPLPLATHDFPSGTLDDAFAFLKRTRSELRMLRRVHVWRDRLQIFDVNGDTFEITGLGYPDADITAVLDNINTAYKRELIHEPTDSEFKEFKTGRRYTWANDRVM